MVNSVTNSGNYALFNNKAIDNAGANVRIRPEIPVADNKGIGKPGGVNDTITLSPAAVSASSQPEPLSEEELKLQKLLALIEKKFNYADTDDNGTLDPEEVINAILSATKELGDDAALQQFAARAYRFISLSGEDGGLQLQELLARFKEGFGQAIQEANPEIGDNKFAFVGPDISKEDYIAENMEMFNQMDANSDGKVSAGELREFLTAKANELPPDEALQMMATYAGGFARISNGDSELTEEELMAFLNKNYDGMGVASATPPGKPEGPAGEVISDLAKPQGTTPSESGVSLLFAKADKDNDGYVTTKDLVKVLNDAKAEKQDKVDARSELRERIEEAFAKALSFNRNNGNIDPRQPDFSLSKAQYDLYLATQTARSGTEDDSSAA